MASLSSRVSTRSSTHDTKSNQKRKSNSNHKSPTTPGTSITKTTTISQSQQSLKTQATLPSILESQKASDLTPSHEPSNTKSTRTSKEIKQEKLDNVKPTPNEKQNPIEVSSPNEDELYSMDKYTDSPTSTKSPPAPPPTDCTKTTSTTSPSNINPSRLPQHNPPGRGGRGGRTLINQGRGGRSGAGPILPPRHLTESYKKQTPPPKTPSNLNKEFEKESTPTSKTQTPPLPSTPPPPPPPTSLPKQHLPQNDQIKKAASEASSTTTQTTATQSVIDIETNTTSSSTTASHKPSSLKESKYKSTQQTQTKIQANLAGSPLNSTRYSMNFSVTKEQKGTRGLREALMIIFTTMIELCPDIVICTWKENEKLQNLKTPESIPTTITLLQKYFDGARTSMTGGRIYMKINIGYPITADRITFQRDFKQYCDDSDIKFYRATVQHHNVKTICWLAYLTNYTNCELLSQVMTKAFRASTGKSVEIGLSWRKLNSQKDVTKNDQVYAIHVECPYEHTAIVKRFLRSCSHQKIYPGGTKFRVINEYWPYMTEPNKKKYRYMKDKHKYFLDNIGLCSTSQPIDIDTRIPGAKATIRTILLSIRDKRDNHRVFNSIDIRWNSDSIYNITYRPDKKSMAYMFCNSLSTYVHHMYPTADLSKIFTLDAIDKAHEETYNEDSQTFITQEDLAMQMELTNDADDDSLEWHDFSQIRPLDDDLSDATPDVEIRNPKLFDLSGETESVSTIGNSVSSTVTFREEEDENAEVQSLASQTSTKTIDSKSSQNLRIDTIESSTLQTSNEVAALRTEMTNFMKLINKTIPNLHMASTLDEQAMGSE